MKKNVLALVFSSALLAPVSVLAAGMEPGFYLGGGYAMATVDYDGVSQDADLGVLFARAGYQANDYVAIEARLGTGIQDDKIEGVKIEAEDMYGAYLKLGLPTEIGLYPYALVGMTHAKLKYSVPGASLSDSGSDVSYGVGADYWINKNTSVGLEFAKLYDKDGVSVEGITLGANYKF